MTPPLELMHTGSAGVAVSLSDVPNGKIEQTVSEESVFSLVSRSKDAKRISRIEGREEAEARVWEENGKPVVT